MSAEYQLFLATIIEPLQALQIVSRGFELEWVDEPNGPCLFGSGMLVGSNQGIEFQSIIEEEFGFVPNITIWFRLNWDADFEKADRIMIRVTIELLRQISKDAVLLFNYDSTVLQRLGGNLLLNDAFNPWITDLLPEVTLPYEIRNLPSL
ncbi:hypothetical protein C7B69_05740 [filamentous cyanobacterium Phorm 46]|nr:hypothetical protein C7B69_05740 [filamentous cyanobacterium Phorm 46]PSB46623.1 hypothetical protein C7B67_20040 [filamentous cyanobacterium Phorm 6]